MPTYAVLGATGNTGQSLLHVLSQSPDPKIQINAYVRSKSKLLRLSPNLASANNVRIFEGDLHNISLISECISGTKAVFMAVAVSDNVPGCNIALDTAHTVVAALEKLHSKDPYAKLPRLICLSSASLNDYLCHDLPQVVHWMLLNAFSYIYADLIKAEEYLRSHKDWITSTFVKPGGLVHDEQKGHTLSTEKQQTFLSFLDLAAGMVEIADTEGDKWDMKNVSVLPTAKDVKISWGSATVATATAVNEVKEEEMATMMNSQSAQTVIPKSHVGFDSITHQIERKLLKRGFQFNVICVGQTGLGKSTLINTIFASHLLNSKGRVLPNEPIRNTTDIEAVSHIIEENGVRLRLNIVDTPGYGDLVNNDRCWDPIIKYIKYQYGAYLHKELTAERERYIQDTRIHCCLFFIQPSGHALKPIDIVVLKKLCDVVNVVPVIAKSDSLTLEERQVFKDRIKQEFAFHNLRMYPYDNEEYDSEEVALNSQIKHIIPFAVVGSEKSMIINGRQVRGRQNRWGVINVEDENHCEFVYLRNFLTRTHLQDLIETTSQIHYESYRGKELNALKERSTGGMGGGSRPISPGADRELSRGSQRMAMNGY